MTDVTEPKILNCYRVLYSTINLERHPKLDGDGNEHQQAGQPVRMGTRQSTDHNAYVVATNSLEAGDFVKTMHPDVDEVHVQQSSAVASNVHLA